MIFIWTYFIVYIDIQKVRTQVLPSSSKKSFVSPCETKSKPLLSSIVLVYALILHTYWHLDLSPLHFQSSSMASDDIFPFRNWSISAVVRLLWRNKCKASSERYRSSCSSLSQRQKNARKLMTSLFCCYTVVFTPLTWPKLLLPIILVKPKFAWKEKFPLNL